MIFPRSIDRSFRGSCVSFDVDLCSSFMNVLVVAAGKGIQKKKATSPFYFLLLATARESGFLTTDHDSFWNSCGVKTPLSQMIAVTYLIGVMSKAGFKAIVPCGANLLEPIFVTSSGLRSSITTSLVV